MEQNIKIPDRVLKENEKKFVNKIADILDIDDVYISKSDNSNKKIKF